jgi:hypothetical protein
VISTPLFILKETFIIQTREIHPWGCEMLYHLLGNAIVDEQEYAEKWKSGELEEFFQNLKRYQKGHPVPKSQQAIRLSSGKLTFNNYISYRSAETLPGRAPEDAGNLIPFTPIGDGKPLTIEIREVYTGKFPGHGKKAMLITSAVKSWKDQDPKPHAINFVKKDVGKNNRIETVGATEHGTPIVYYSPAVMDDLLSYDLSIAFQDIPKELIDKFGNLFHSAAAIPVFLPYSACLFAAGSIIKISGTLAKSVFDGNAEFFSSEKINIKRPGIPTYAGYNLVTSRKEPLDSDFISKFHPDNEGRLVDKQGNPYTGDIPYVVVCLDGAAQEELASFAPMAASAQLLSKFITTEENQNVPFDTLFEGIKLYNDYQYRTRVNTIDGKLKGSLKDEEKAALEKEREALIKNILTEDMKPK